MFGIKQEQFEYTNYNCYHRANVHSHEVACQLIQVSYLQPKRYQNNQTTYNIAANKSSQRSSVIIIPTIYGADTEIKKNTFNSLLKSEKGKN